MKLVQAERNGESFDSQLVIGVRDSYGKENRLSSDLINLLFVLQLV
jgi:hypothetical protein